MNEPTYAELLEALEECVDFMRGISNFSSEYIDHMVDSYVKGELEELIARAKGGDA